MGSDESTLLWDDAVWLNPPPAEVRDGADLVVTTAPNGDFWRRTHYGHTHDSGHALLVDFPQDSAVEVTFSADLVALYDQAGLLVRVDEEQWVKAGVEATGGIPVAGAVVTRGTSDWSMTQVPNWTGRPVTVRISRSHDALTIRARGDDGPWYALRMCHLDPDARVTAGPYCCSPQREGLTVRFSGFTVGPADRTSPEEM